FLDFPWKLASYDPALTEKDFPSERSEGAQGTIDIDKEGAIRINYLDQVHNQLSFTGLDFDWSVENLILWLDRHIPHPDVIQPDAIGFLNGVLNHLLQTRNLKLENLVRDKYRLKAAIQKKIQEFRLEARTQAYQQLLLPEAPTPIEVRPEICFAFKPDEYPYNTVFRGSYSFKKHFYPRVGDLSAEGEEFECAVFLDTLPEVKFWVRNLERRQQHSFWLQTSSDKFYPDFVCALEDGRFLVVEYKGADRWSNDDSQEKRMIGELWEERSNGKCLFIMPKGKDLPAIKTKIVSA
ncbi:MAG: restriction endonuclease subunit R, partial [Candidatus Riflebacteria bacterium]